MTLDTSGATLLVQRLETLTGGVGTEVITIGSAGTTLGVSLLETLTGGAEKAHIFSTVLRAIPNRHAVSRRLRPSTKTERRTSR
ncbi:hypothetical protein CCP1ISM_9940001 [Azospirillaceae bacterium]